MGKLIKYEFRKQLFSKLVICFFLALFEAVFLIGVALEKEKMMGIGWAFFALVAFISLIYLGFEAVTTYSNDLKTKQSYMLFLVPRSSYEIVGAKMIATVVQLFAYGAVFAGFAALDIVILCAKYGQIDELFQNIIELVKMFNGTRIAVTDFIWVFTLLLVSWLEFITMAMLAITLSTTLFANKKWKGIVSFLIYLVLNWGVGKIASLILKDKFFTGGSIIVNSAAWMWILFYFIVIVLDFLGTAVLLEKKVSV